MYIKTDSGALVNFDKLSKVDITVAGDDSILRGLFNDYRTITLFVGTYEECKIAMQNLEEAIITKTKILSYYEYSMKDGKNEQSI